MSRTPYRALFEHCSDLVSVLTPDGVVLEANARWAALLQAPETELTGRHIRDFAAPGYEDRNAALFAEALRLGTSQDRAIPLRGPGGTTIYVDFTAVPLAGDDRLTLLIGHDVTPQRQAAQSLTDAEQRYRSLVERLPEVIWVGAADGRISFVTPNVEALLGCTPAEFCAVTWAERLEQIHPEDRGRMSAAWDGMVSEGHPFDLEYRRRNKEGSWIWLHNRVIADRDRDGDRVIEGMISDVTERRRLTESVVQAQKMEALGQLTGGIAHDFNNILAAILANSQFLAEDLGLQDPRRECADEIRIAAERAAGLTRQLLAFSRRQILEPSVMDLNTIVVGIEKMLRRLIGEDLELVTALGPAPGNARVDVGQLEQVILNLVVNARDATPAGGTITIATRNAVVEETGAIPAGRYVVLEVSDTGTGMSAETQRRIFEPFFTTKGMHKGTGLGLSTCYGIVQQSGGQITVESELGAGTKFTVHLPRVDARPDRARRLTQLPRHTATETILLIEDDERLRKAIVRMLEPRGYRLLVARDGAEALAIAGGRADPIDVVVSDVVMPGLSGPDVVAQLRDLGHVTRALFMSGYTDHVLLDRDELIGQRNFLHKPFTTEALLKKLREVLDA